MATVNPVKTDISGNGQVFKFVWDLTTANLNGSPIPADMCEFADRTIYIGGGIWGAATLVWQGGDGTNWQTLTDAQTVAISRTADFIETVVETPEFSRPFLSVAGTGAVLTITAICRRGFKRQ